MSLSRRLKDFNISSKGFLPEECVKIWEVQPFDYIDPIHTCLHTIDSSTLRSVVENSKPTDLGEVLRKIDDLSNDEYSSLYSVLSMTVNRYLWCTWQDKNREKSVEEVRKIVIPKHIGLPWIKVSKKMGIKPALTHAAVDLYNWELKNRSDGFHLDNLKSINLMTGNESEQWFYLIMVAIEGECAPIIPLMCNVNHMLKSALGSGLDVSSSQSVNNELVEKLKQIKKHLEKASELMGRMREHCDPEFFFNVIRIYLSGYSKKDILPNGLQIEDYPENIDSDGGSAAQSTLIPLIDAFFSIEHVGEHSKDFMINTKKYMPKIHVEFLELFKSQCCLLDYIKKYKDNEVIESIKKCVTEILKFRSIHFRIVGDYILKFTSTNKTSINGVVGTGGSPIELFLGEVNKNVSSAKSKFTP